MDNGGQIDTFILDFEKAFDTPPHELLKSKLFGCGIGKTLEWVDSFLCYRKQRVVIIGVKLDWARSCLVSHRALSLVPCCLFSLYINDISTDIDSEIRRFADDCVCYREIKDKEGTLKPQKDIDQ